MKKYIFIIIFILICLYSFAKKVNILNKKNKFKGQTIEEIYDLNDKEFSRLKRKIIYYDKMNKYRIIEYFNSDELIKQYKSLKQISYYKKNGDIDKHEVFYIKKYTEYSGIDKTIDYVDKDDNVLRIEYYLKNQLIDTVESEQDFKLNNSYPFHYIFKRIELIEKTKNESNTPNNINVYDWFGGRSSVKYLNQIKDLEEYEKKFLTNLSKTRKMEDLNNYIKKKILVKENDKKFWILMNDSSLKGLKQDSKLILYYFFGCKDGKAIIHSIGFKIK